MNDTFDITFFILSNIKINFIDQEFSCRLYTISKTLSPISEK